MPVGSNYTTFDASGAGGIGRGLRESLADTIYMITPTETPLLTMAKKVKAEAVFEEWLIDTLDPAVVNAVPEGDDATIDAITAETRVGNRCQIADKAFGISGTLEAVKKAGRKSELSRQLSKKAAELKRDIELALLANTASTTSTEGTARFMGGLPSWLSSNTNFGATGADGGFSGGNTVARTNGTPRAFAEAQINGDASTNGVMQDCWDNGGKPSVILLGGKQRRIFSTFDGVATASAGGVKFDAKDKTIYGAMDVYISNYGTLRVMPDRFIRKVSSIDYDVFGIDPDYVEIAELRPFHINELARTGDREQRQLIWEGTLKVLNEAAHFLVTDLN